jgi:large subunit ribosomal protein L9
VEVILLQKVRNLGDLGDTVSVRPGYGRNYLMPRGIALPATKANLAVFEERRSELQAASQEREDRAQARADQLKGKEYVIAMRASDEGKLFGSVGPQEISDAITEDGVEVNPKEVTLTEGTIRVVGEYTALLQLHAEVEVEVTVIVAQ